MDVIRRVIMTQKKITVTFFRGFSFFIAIVVLMAIPATAMGAGGGGPTPDRAITLDDEVNSGALAPTDQHWFKFTIEDNGTPFDVEKALTLILTPNTANTVWFIGLKIFKEDQVPFFLDGSADNMAHIGAGSVVTRDTNPETGEQFWTGWVSTSKTYYIQLQNNSDFPIDYRLYNADISSPPLDEPEETPPATIETAPTEPETAPTEPQESQAEPEELAEPETPAAPDPNRGDSPVNPIPLQDGLIKDKLAPESVTWYSMHYPDFTGEKTFQELDFTMFFTPDDGNRKHRVNFELFASSELEFWQRGDVDKITNFGAGRLVSRDGDYNTGERIWRGTVLKDNDYLMAVENGTDVEIDYWLFNEDIYNPELGPKAAPAPPRVFAEGASPQTAQPLKVGVNKGGLEPGEEEWYSFFITDFDEESFEEMALTMIATPGDGNRIRYTTFDVFPAGNVQGWSPGDNSQINNMGAGSFVERDNNPLTGHRIWKGWVIDNDRYLVQIRNGTGQHMDYWLFTGDVYDVELGEKTAPVARTPAKIGTAPSAPLALELGVNEGTLSSGQERWYAFSRSDVDRGSRIQTVFTMLFNPDDGNSGHNVNFELFEGNQLRDWAPDNRFNLDNFGQGARVNRDNNPETGELLWEGHVLAGDLYYMRITNESGTTIEYQIFPDDVVEANLDPVK